VVVDGEEQNRFEEDELFAMNLDAAVNVNRWLVTENYDLLDAEHNGYSRLNVVHRRLIYFNKEEKYWVIKDMLTGVGRHKFELYFHFAPMALKKKDELVIETGNETGANIAIAPLETDGLKLAIENGWVSYSYGQKVEAPIVKYSKTAEVPAEFVTCIYSNASKAISDPELAREAIELVKL
jgi:hypothetical protein